MTKRRLYVQKVAGKPEFDLWLEAANTQTDIPEIRFCFNRQDTEEPEKGIAMSVTVPTAARMVKALEDLIGSCSEPVEDYAVEE